MDANNGELNAEQWERLKAVVADALEKPDVAERRAFVVSACQDDPAVLREAEAMLAFSPQRLEARAETIAAALRRAEPNRTDERIGSYRIIRELGRGGMGAVYLAERADDEFKKQVAIKLLKRGTDTDEVLRRFRSEREILARLEHPNIARLIDGGTTDHGLPYFVMECVVGEPVTDFCSSRALSVEDRLRLFLKICGAVQFAHQNLVIHRDLKPGNILVTPESEPKLLDFGIAKLLAAEDGIMSLTIADHQRLTPAYASPEQVRGEPVTTASDVYALGALLYELLTGTNAHTFATAPPSPTELLRVVGDVAPVRPSAAAADPATAQKLRGDLDNILLHALRKEPARRYPTVNGMAEDVRRYLGNFPVRARKDTVGYRASKFVRRNRLGVAAAALVLLALVIGLGVAAWQAQVAAAQAKVARAERTKAEQRFNQVRELARAVLFDYHDAIATLPGATAVRQRLVQDAVRYLDALSNEAANDPSLQREVADAYEKVAAVQGGYAASARGIHLSASNLGDAAGALTSQRKALAMREMLVSTTPPDPKDLNALARSHYAIAAFTWAVGTVEETAAHFRRSIELVEPLLAREPASREFRVALGRGYDGLGRVLGTPSLPNLGDTAGALENVRKSIAIFEKLVADHPADLDHRQSLASAYNAIAGIYQGAGDLKEQLAAYRNALEASKAIVAADPQNVLYRRELAVQLGNLGSGLMQSKDRAGALPYFREALTIFEGLVAADPSDFGVRRALAVGYRNVGVCVGTNDPAEALRNLRKATDTLVELVGKDPKNIDFRRQWAFTYLATSRFQTEVDDLAAAVASAHEGIKIEEAVVADAPGDVSAQTTMALLQRQLGIAEAKWATKTDQPTDLQKEHWRSARAAYGKSLAVYQALLTAGKLPGADAAKPDELAAEIVKCDAALQAVPDQAAARPAAGSSVR